jgi:DNA repair protein RadC
VQNLGCEHLADRQFQLPNPLPAKRPVSEARRKRLRQVIEPLTAINNFTNQQAKACCREANPGYVTKNLKVLVNEGLLAMSAVDSTVTYRWTSSPNEIDPERWIDRQIHGMQVKETPEQERPRERLMRDGARPLSNSDLLAILIRVGVRNESAIVAAQKLATRFASNLAELPKLSPEDLKDVSRAITKASYSQIMAGIELGRRIAKIEAQQGRATAKITSTREAIEYCESEFSRLALDAVQEEFHIVTLDTKHKPIHTHLITRGTLDASLVHPREVFRPAIRDSASAILLVHNHPSGDPTPSREDHSVTDQLTEAGRLLGITVLDHIVVARQRCLSIRESDRC